MLYKKALIDNFINCFKEAISDDRKDYLNFLGIDDIGKLDYLEWGFATLDELKKDIVKDENLISFILNLADCNSGININNKYRVYMNLLKDEDNYDHHSVFVTLEVCFYQGDEFYSDRINWIWKGW